MAGPRICAAKAEKWSVSVDNAEFDRLVTYEKKRQKSLEQVYNMLDPERGRGQYLRDHIDESETSRDTWDGLNRMVQHYLRELRTLPH